MMLCWQSFNELPRQRLNNGLCADTYGLAEMIEVYLKSQGIYPACWEPLENEDEDICDIRQAFRDIIAADPATTKTEDGPIAAIARKALKDIM
jgi:hypothetical protein